MGRGKSFEQSDLRLAAVEPGVMVLDSISGRGIGICYEEARNFYGLLSFVDL